MRSVQRNKKNTVYIHTYIYINNATVHLSRSQHLHLIEWSGYRLGDRQYFLDSWKLHDSSTFQRVQTGSSVRQSSNSLGTGGTCFGGKGTGA